MQVFLLTLACPRTTVYDGTIGRNATVTMDRNGTLTTWNVTVVDELTSQGAWRRGFVCGSLGVERCACCALGNRSGWVWRQDESMTCWKDTHAAYTFFAVVAG